MNGDVKLEDLAAINRTLAEDLNVSRRLLHQLRCEKAALERNVEAADARAERAELLVRRLGATLEQANLSARAAVGELRDHELM